VLRRVGIFERYIRGFEEFGFHWSYWTYKAVCNRIYPDGIYQYCENPPWINRSGLIQGWETFPSLWEKRKKEIVSSWRTVLRRIKR